MTRIAEKLGFITGQAVEVCVKAGIRRRVVDKQTCFHAYF
jgi:hypothetical protein